MHEHAARSAAAKCIRPTGLPSLPPSAAKAVIWSFPQSGPALPAANISWNLFRRCELLDQQNSNFANRRPNPMKSN
jgi:hypothetical protein